MTTSNKRSKGFTLIELLVVITIIGVLTSLFVANMVSVRERAKDSQKKSNLNEFKTALRLYYNDNQNYPDVSEVPAQGSPFVGTGGVVYMQEVPEYASYTVDATGDGFTLGVDLDNLSDTEICESWSRCGENSCVIGTSATYYVCAD
ncbi:MAG: type II secretion system protein [Pseudomonadales bacterium]|nr:type II secretion system protein [Candidatus Woesebacteria bacterium]MCB9801456.1 type II secretion system protein [Pseudomonadales bacterium]